MQNNNQYYRRCHRCQQYFWTPGPNPNSKICPNCYKSRTRKNYNYPKETIVSKIERLRNEVENKNGKQDKE